MSIPSKEELWSLNRDELYDFVLMQDIDHLEFLDNMGKDYLKSLKNKEFAWTLYERDKNRELNHWIFDGYRYNPSLEEAFDLNNPRCIYYSDRYDYDEYLEQLKTEKENDNFFQYHHIKKTVPNWLSCVNQITSALNEV